MQRLICSSRLPSGVRPLEQQQTLTVIPPPAPPPCLILISASCRSGSAPSSILHLLSRPLLIHPIILSFASHSPHPCHSVRRPAWTRGALRRRTRRRGEPRCECGSCRHVLNGKWCVKRGAKGDLILGLRQKHLLGQVHTAGRARTV